MGGWPRWGLAEQFAACLIQPLSPSKLDASHRGPERTAPPAVGRRRSYGRGWVGLRPRRAEFRARPLELALGTDFLPARLPLVEITSSIIIIVKSGRASRAIGTASGLCSRYSPPDYLPAAQMSLSAWAVRYSRWLARAPGGLLVISCSARGCVCLPSSPPWHVRCTAPAHFLRRAG